MAPDISTLERSIRPTLLKIVDSIAEFNVFHTDAVGVSGIKTDQWKRFERLQELATIHELTTLCRHPNATMRAYAFFALSQRPDTQILAQLQFALSDTASLEYFIHCERGTIREAVLALQMVTSDWVSHKSYQLSAKDRERVVIWLMHRLAWHS